MGQTLTDNGLIATNPIARQVLLDQFVTLFGTAEDFMVMNQNYK